jgi:hypothetical protein
MKAIRTDRPHDDTTDRTSSASFQGEGAQHRDTSRAWLELFPPNRRSLVANTFHHAVRRGCRTAADVLVIVSFEFKQSLGSLWKEDDGSEFCQLVLAALHGEQRAAALEYAASVIRYERLPSAQRRALTAQRREPYRLASMDGKPITDAQRRILRNLGYDGEPVDRREASDLIEALLRKSREDAR